MRDALLDTLSRPAIPPCSSPRGSRSRHTGSPVWSWSHWNNETPRRSSATVYSKPGAPAQHPSDAAALPQLLALLGGLPLSCRVDRDLRRRQRLPLSEIIREVQEDGLNAEALSFDPSARRAPASSVPGARSPPAGSHFAGLSVLAGATFPREAALAAGRGERPARASGRPVGDLAALEGYSLVEALPGGQRLRLHPQVARVCGGATGGNARRDAGRS